MQNTLLIDAHVHLYPQFNAGQAITAGMNNMKTLIQKNKLPQDTIKVWLMTEGMAYHAFDTLQNELSGEYNLSQPSPECFEITSQDSPDNKLYIFAGRQIVTADKLEVCSLVSNFAAPDRQHSTVDVLNMVAESGAVPALNWAPGKWMFQRGKLVQQILQQSSPENMLISETTMRPTVWATPALVKYALNKGFHLLAGSDPLPFTGEENLIGSYVCKLTGEFDPKDPAASVRTMLMSRSIAPVRLGKRSGPFKFASRQLNIMNYNRKSH